MPNAIAILAKHGIQATPQRIAILECVLLSKAHPSADEVWEQVKQVCPTVSRATVYNTLNLLVESRLLKAQILREGLVVFDANVQLHHHFIDEQTGQIYDIPWDKLRVSGPESLEGFQVREYQVVLRGKKQEERVEETGEMTE